MKALSITMRVLAILGALAAAYFWYSTNGQLAQKQKQIDSANADAADALAAKEASDAELKKVTGEKQASDKALAAVRAEVDVIQRQGMEARREADNATARYTKAERDLVTLQSEYDLMKRMLDGMGGSADEVERLAIRLEDVNGMLAAREDELRVAQAKVKELEDMLSKDVGSMVNNFNMVFDYQILSVDPKKGVCVITGQGFDSMKKGQKFYLHSIKPGVTGSAMNITVSSVHGAYVVADIVPDTMAWNVNKFVDGQVVKLSKFALPAEAAKEEEAKVDEAKAMIE